MSTGQFYAKYRWTHELTNYKREADDRHTNPPFTHSERQSEKCKVSDVIGKSLEIFRVSIKAPSVSHKI